MDTINTLRWQLLPNLQTINLTLCTFTFSFLLTHPLTHSSPFLPFVFIPLLPAAPTNLSLLFYLPEGERFWITGLINKVNTGCQPLTQHCADRVEEERKAVRDPASVWGASMCVSACKANGWILYCLSRTTGDFIQVADGTFQIPKNSNNNFTFVCQDLKWLIGFHMIYGVNSRHSQTFA